GIINSEAPEIVQHLDVLEPWAKANLGGNLSRIRVITAKGTSMKTSSPESIDNGDVLFVDATIQTFDGEGIYIISRGPDVQVKRLQKLQGDVLAIISDNHAYVTERLTSEEADSVVICGRVLASWTLKKFW
ncbi:MAG: hypothetical protein RLY95_960, partial [Pseudomonadota bacterium]